jgi:two-component system, cell cycle sensor histidine kinase and response regulator CckA
VASTEPVNAPSTSQTRGLVLVVDDEPHAANVTSRMLHDGGYSTVEVSNARDALSALELANPLFDLVVTDVVMPETDGRTLGRLIAERHPGLPVIYISAYPEQDIFHRGSPGPQSAFLQKPFSPDVLLSLVREQLATATQVGNRRQRA